MLCFPPLKRRFFSGLWQTNDVPADSSRTESTLLERLDVYKAAVANAKQAGESSKVRRYERGLKVRH